MKTILYLTVLIYLLLSNCTNRKQRIACRKGNRIEIAQKVKDYFYFKPGTYWVYQNQTTLATDSHWVCNSYIGTESLEKSGCNCYQKQCYENMSVEILNNKYNECHNKVYLVYYINLDLNRVQNYTKDNYWFGLQTGRKTVGVSFFYPDDKWVNIGLKDTNNYKIDNINYTECIIERTRPSIVFDHSYEIVMNRGIGIISYLDTANVRWNLLRHNIIK